MACGAAWPAALIVESTCVASLSLKMVASPVALYRARNRAVGRR
jgi:hypothetical protein